MAVLSKRKNKKQPKIKNQPNTAKEPKLVHSPPDQISSWSFQILDKNGPFGWGKLESHEKYYEILERLKEHERKNFIQLNKMGKSGSLN